MVMEGKLVQSLRKSFENIDRSRAESVGRREIAVTVGIHDGDSTLVRIPSLIQGIAKKGQSARTNHHPRALESIATDLRPHVAVRRPMSSTHSHRTPHRYINPSATLTILSTWSY
jgi:hypothetical protein